MKFWYTFSLVLLSIMAFAQEDFNMTLESKVILNEDGSDIWGYVDGNGIEYAVMGGRSNTYIWSLEDFRNPIERAVIPGGPSTWRDIKSWDDHLYVTNDGSPDGLLVIDMSKAPNDITYNYIKPEFSVDNNSLDTLGRCHNIFIDEHGFCYLSGCRQEGANKAIIFDLNQDKKNPPIVGIHGGVPNGPEYSHDLYVHDNIMYSSEIYAGNITLFDVTRKDSIIELGDAMTSSNFTHNAWASDDDQYVFTTDERGNGQVDSYDVSDPSNIKRLDEFKPLETANRGVIPHNTHYINGYLVTSWYTDGVVITDVARPDNMIKVGSFDTYTFGHGGFNGCWGAYPWLPSGIVLTSNITNNPDADISVGELNIFTPTYIRACYLEGTVTDAANANLINAVDVSISTSEANEALTNAIGIYKTGLANAGTFDVTFSHPDYFPKTVVAEMENGVLTILDVELDRRPEVEALIKVVNASNGNAIPLGQLKFDNPERSFEIRTDSSGIFEDKVFDESYDVVVGAWGFQHKLITDISLKDGEELVIELDPGYQDDFVLDQGWIVNGDARTGQWVRDVPIPTQRGNGTKVNVDVDIEGDIGDECYMTGNGGGGVGNDDVDDGLTRLSSPLFNVSGYTNPVLQYRIWFYTESNNQNGPHNDTLFVRIWDKSNLVTVDMYTQSFTGWSELVEIPLTGLVDTQEDLRLAFITSDLETSGHLLEAAIDVFKIVEGTPSQTNDQADLDAFKVYPNPFSNEITIESKESTLKSISVFDNLGQLVYHTKPSHNQFVINQIRHKGLYLVLIEDQNNRRIIKKIVKE